MAHFFREFKRRSRHFSRSWLASLETGQVGRLAAGAVCPAVCVTDMTSGRDSHHTSQPTQYTCPPAKVLDEPLKLHHRQSVF